MYQNRWLKGALIGLALIVLGAMTVNLLQKMEERPEAPPVEPLSGDTSQLSTEVVFQNYDGGKVVFQVKSAESRLSGEGVQMLSKVNLAIFRPPDRQLAEHVWAESASYEDKKHSVAFKENVTITLDDNTVVTSESAFADLQEKSVQIAGSFRIQRESVEGEGRSLLYDAAENLLVVRDGISLTLPEKSGTVRMSANTAKYQPRLGHLLLAGNSRIDNALQHLSSDEIQLWLSEERKLEKATAVGTVVVEDGSGRVEGDELKLRFAPGTGQLVSFRLASRNPDQPALYRSGSGAGAQILRARVIMGVPARKSEPGAIQLERIEAMDQVEIQWKEAGIESARARHLTGEFSSGSHFETLDLTGGVQLVREEDGTRETIKSEELRLTLTAGPTLEKLTATGNPSFVVESAGSRRTLAARKEITIIFRDGKASRLDTEGASRILDEAGGQRTVIRASRLTNDYEDGRPVSLLADGPVHLKRGTEEQPLTATARKMRLHYSTDGKLRHSELTGKLVLRQKTPDGVIELTGERGLIKAGGEVIEVVGERRPRLRSLTAAGEVGSVTNATSFLLNAAGHGIEATGPVETRVPGNRLLIIKAGGMRAESGSPWIVYDGRPRLQMDENIIESDHMRLESRRLLLEAEGSIRAFVKTVEADKHKDYRVTADHLTLDRESHQATFSGHVQADSDDFELEASKMNLHFSGPDLAELVRMVALDDVRMVEEERRALGDKAVYAPAEGTVTITGETAQVIDSKQGKAIGNRLTFTLGDDTLLIE